MNPQRQLPLIEADRIPVAVILFAVAVDGVDVDGGLGGGGSGGGDGGGLGGGRIEGVVDVVGNSSDLGLFAGFVGEADGDEGDAFFTAAACFGAGVVGFHGALDALRLGWSAIRDEIAFAADEGDAERS